MLRATRSRCSTAAWPPCCTRGVGISSVSNASLSYLCQSASAARLYHLGRRHHQRQLPLPAKLSCLSLSVPCSTGNQLTASCALGHVEHPSLLWRDLDAVHVWEGQA